MLHLRLFFTNQLVKSQQQGDQVYMHTFLTAESTPTNSPSTRRISSGSLYIGSCARHVSPRPRWKRITPQLWESLIKTLPQLFIATQRFIKWRIFRGTLFFCHRKKDNKRPSLGISLYDQTAPWNFKSGYIEHLLMLIATSSALFLFLGWKRELWFPVSEDHDPGCGKLPKRSFWVSPDLFCLFFNTRNRRICC